MIEEEEEDNHPGDHLLENNYRANWSVSLLGSCFKMTWWDIIAGKNLTFTQMLLSKI